MREDTLYCGLAEKNPPCHTPRSSFRALIAYQESRDHVFLCSWPCIPICRGWERKAIPRRLSQSLLHFPPCESNSLSSSCSTGATLPATSPGLPGSHPNWPCTLHPTRFLWQLHPAFETGGTPLVSARLQLGLKHIPACVQGKETLLFADACNLHFLSNRNDLVVLFLLPEHQFVAQQPSLSPFITIITAFPCTSALPG